jgi:hypothetical protein
MSSLYLKCGPGFVGIGLFGCFRSLFLVIHFENVSFFFKLWDFILYSAENWKLLSVNVECILRIPKKRTSVEDPGCLSRIPDPNCFHPGSRIRIFPSRIPVPDFFTHPGSRIQGSKRHRIPDPRSGSATLQRTHNGEKNEPMTICTVEWAPIQGWSMEGPA